MPDESGPITVGLALTMWCLALLGVLGALVWTRSRATGTPRPVEVRVRSTRVPR